jgi:hypothetical protein
MRTTRFDNLKAGGSVGKAPHQEMALFLAALTFGLAMLSLLAVLLLADIVALSHILPFFALPLVLFIATAPLFRRWVKREAEEAEVAHRALQPPPPSLRRASTDEFDTTRQALESTTATRR